MGQSVSTPTTQGSSASAGSGGCPVDHTKFQNAEINPLNNIPNLPQNQAPGQKSALPLERTISSIPKADVKQKSPGGDAPKSACPVNHETSGNKGPSSATENWEYPSPQQFHNALVRKGWETPEESVETMVEIHNWLNESAWSQIRQWEEKHPGGDKSTLAFFQGNPDKLTPKARYHMALGKLFPNWYACIRPFDRHDWVVHRPDPDVSNTSIMSGPPSKPRYSEHRYVIDYYHLQDDAEGNPVFSLDVRPAVDSLEAVQDRLNVWWDRKRKTWFGEQ